MNNYLYRSQCDLEIYRERPFIFNNQKKHNERQLEDLMIAEARIGTHISRNLDYYSLQLFLKAIYENFVYRPFRAAINFGFVTKTIFYIPSTKIKDDVLVLK